MEINEKDRVTERVSAALSFLMTENMLHYISVLENESDRSSGYEQLSGICDPRLYYVKHFI